MTRIATLRCPCVHDSNYTAVLRTLKKLAEFGPEDVRFNPNVQKPNHWVVYVDVHMFLDPVFDKDFRALDGKECLKVFLPNKAYVLVGIGKSQEECDAEVAAAAAAGDPIHVGIDQECDADVSAAGEAAGDPIHVGIDQECDADVSAAGEAAAEPVLKAEESITNEA